MNPSNASTHLQPTKGFTLIEVIVSIALLGVLALIIVTVFGTSFTQIFTSGRKSQAVAAASETMELLHSLESATEEGLVTLLESKGGIETDDEADRYQQQPADTFNFWVEPTSLFADSDRGQGFQVTLVVFYEGGTRHITLSSFIKQGGATP